MCADVAELATKKGGIMPLLKSILAQYAQIRYMSEKGSFWDPKLAAEDPNKKLTQIKTLNK
jgi:hypothetical protein